MALCASSPPWPKTPFESEIIKLNRESWGNGKANRHDLSFLTPHSFLSYLIFWMGKPRSMK
jgi:hypothetical protein